MAMTLYNRMSRRISNVFWIGIGAIFACAWFMIVGAIIYVIAHFVFKY